MIDHVLLIGFGGPTKPEEIRPFLEQVTRGVRVPAERLNEVAHHYERVGGRSPYTDHTMRLLERLADRLKALGLTIPLFLGMRNWHPFLHDVVGQISRQGLREGLGIILAPHRCFTSFERYVNDVDEAKARVGASALQYRYVGPWHDHPLFIGAQADRVRQTLGTLSPEARAGSTLLFSAHSIPCEMARQSRYAQEIESSSRSVANVLGWTTWRVVYQSRSGSPHQPWLEPSVVSAMRQLAHEGEREIVVVPIGFLCDHVEVLFDLDVEAREAADQVGVRFARVSTVMDHPAFVDLLVQCVAGAANGSVAR